jgi:hypothetical protein
MRMKKKHFVFFLILFAGCSKVDPDLPRTMSLSNLTLQQIQSITKGKWNIHHASVANSTQRKDFSTTVSYVVFDPAKIVWVENGAPVFNGAVTYQGTAIGTDSVFVMKELAHYFDKIDNDTLKLTAISAGAFDYYLLKQ